ncbi:hypothetical protein NSE01_06430 [Novosphingobium sediminis]|uniref:Peptidase inhibitor I78 family protein n=1 Tax=Novosphingobium sediminis TaxID=707214 RepID=A0A512AGJ1_9SPHN|nr:I78 family peptidase inhibitor [Novosphingobium sediminis]GEN98810.1 hypothetical protein NSE01_06430 [Novosphingobium sediminis]
MKFYHGVTALVLLPLYAAVGVPLKAQTTTTDTCSLSLTARFIGARAVPQVRGTVRQVARPHPVRWIVPGQPITLDQDPQRLNVIIDDDGRITVMRCG